MNANESKQIIEAAGGDMAFARLLKIDKQPWAQQRVNNWRRRGIPADVVLAHYSAIQRLRRKALAA